MSHANEVLRYLRSRIGFGPDGKAPAPENDNHQCRSIRLSNPFLPELPLQEQRRRFTLEQHDSLRYYIEHGNPEIAALEAIRCPPTIVCLFGFLTNQNPSCINDGKSISEYAQDTIIRLSQDPPEGIRGNLIESLERFLCSRFLERLATQDPTRHAKLRSEFTSILERLR